MISSLTEMAQALAHADEALQLCEGFLPRIGSEYDPALGDIGQISSDVFRRAERIQQRIRSVLLSRGGL